MLFMEDLKSMEGELARQNGLYLRLVTDFDKFRRRSSQEINRRGAAQKETAISMWWSTCDSHSS